MHGIPLILLLFHLSLFWSAAWAHCFGLGSYLFSTISAVPLKQFSSLVHWPVRTWYSTDVTGLKVFADRSRSIFACALSGGKNTFFTSWLKSAHPGYKPDEELGLTKVGPYLFLFRSAWTSHFSLFFCVLCCLRKYESLALEISRCALLSVLSPINYVLILQLFCLTGMLRILLQ